MTLFIVLWSDNGIFTEKNMKVFEDRDPANWFAKSIESRYNKVKVYVARHGEFDTNE